MNEKNLALILKYSDVRHIDMISRTLQEVNLSNKENLSLLLRHPDLHHLSWVLKTLQGAGFLNEKNVALTLGDSDPYRIRLIFEALKQADLLTADNLALVLEHPEPYPIVLALETLKEAGILTAKTIEGLRYADPYRTALAFKIFHENDHALFSDKILNHLMRIPQHLFTQNVLEQLIKYSRSPNTEKELTEYMDGLLKQSMVSLNGASLFHSRDHGREQGQDTVARYVWQGKN